MKNSFLYFYEIFFNMSRENLKLLNCLFSKTVLFFYILKLISSMLRG